MSEHALSSPEENQNRKKISFSSLLLSDFNLLCSFILSHPFYFSYLLFFSPYIFKILSFLSPLFVTTTLLILALLTTLHVHDSESLETQASFLFSFCNKLGSILEHKFDVNDEGFKSMEAYKMVVEACSMDCVSENHEQMEICSNELTFVDKFCSHESTVSEALTNENSEESIEILPLTFDDLVDLEKEETKKCEKEEEEEQKVKPNSDVVLDNEEEPTKEESKAKKVDFVGDGNDESYDFQKLSDVLGEGKGTRNEVSKKKEEEEDNVSLQSFGSMRKEKEWRRTLACKLFEERHNADVGQGMDQLWETYEAETEKKQQTEEEKKKKLKKKTKSSLMKTKSIEKEVIMEEEEEDEDGIDHQQLCCLQALKFSTGKMHLGIAKPNLLKLSKAFKGFGRFYSSNKHSKKV